MDETNKLALFGKAFRELPSTNIKSTKQKELSESGVKESMLHFKKNNPEMFE